MKTCATEQLRRTFKFPRAIIARKPQLNVRSDLSRNLNMALWQVPLVLLLIVNSFAQSSLEICSTTYQCSQQMTTECSSLEVYVLLLNKTTDLTDVRTLNNVVRWVNLKEDSANKLIAQVARVLALTGADAKDYQNFLTYCHTVILLAEHIKAITNTETATELCTAVNNLASILLPEDLLQELRTSTQSSEDLKVRFVHSFPRVAFQKTKEDLWLWSYGFLKLF